MSGDYPFDEMAFQMGVVMGAWIEFKKGHDLNSEGYNCCEVTQRFFDALNQYEKTVFNEGRKT